MKIDTLKSFIHSPKIEFNKESIFLEEEEISTFLREIELLEAAIQFIQLHQLSHFLQECMDRIFMYFPQAEVSIDLHQTPETENSTLFVMVSLPSIVDVQQKTAFYKDWEQSKKADFNYFITIGFIPNVF